MGWMCSWIAIQGATKSDVFEALNLTETGRAVSPGQGRRAISYAEIAGGWLVLVHSDFDWAKRERIRELSRLGPTVGCQVEDMVEMESVATGAKDGVELWRVFHTNAPESTLEVSGDPPSEFAAIRDRLQQEQDEDDGADYIHDIPLDVAKAACGFRVDEHQGAFLELKSSAQRSGDGSDRGSGLLGRLLSVFRKR